MKKVFMMLALMMATVYGVQAQTTAKEVNMEEVSKIGGNASYDDENCTATFVGAYNRWVDLPGVEGDLSATPNLQMEILKSNVVLKVVLRTKVEGESKPKETEVATFWGQMGREITSSKMVKIHLVNGSKGKVTADDLKQVVSVRISMAKQVEDAEEPWFAQFGKVTLK